MSGPRGWVSALGRLKARLNPRTSSLATPLPRGPLKLPLLKSTRTIPHLKTNHFHSGGSTYLCILRSVITAV